jgi:cation transport regulator ChaB
LPYQTNADIPEAVRDRFSARCQTVWREAWNDHFERSHDEAACFAVAEAAAQNCKSATKSADQVPARAVKFSGKDTIEGPVFLFGYRDTDGDTFTAETDFCIDWFGKSGRPVLYEHGLDDELKSTVIGRQVDFETRAEGIWAQSELNRHFQYRKTVDKMIEAGQMGYSGGAMPHLARKSAKTSEITRFPWVEASLTPTPAAAGNLGIYYLKSADALAHMEAVDFDIPGPLKAALTALDEWAASRDSDSLPDGLKVADLIDRLSVDGPAWVKARRDWYAKSGRVLSAATRERLAAHPQALRQLADDLDELLTSADGGKSAKVDLLTLLAETGALDDRLLGLSLTAKGL